MHPDRTMASISIEGRHELERFFLSFAPDRETYALPVVEALRTCGESSRRSLLVARIDGLVRDSMLDLSKKSCLPLLSIQASHRFQICSLTRSTRRNRIPGTKRPAGSVDKRPSSTATSSWTKSQHLRSLARNAGETLLIADFSAIVMHNRRSRRQRIFEQVDIEKVDCIRTHPLRRDEDFIGNSKRSVDHTCLAYEVLDSRLLEALNTEMNSASSWSGSKRETNAEQILAVISSMICCYHRSDVDFHLNASFQFKCVETVARYENRKDPRAYSRDPLLTRLRANIEFLWQEASSRKIKEYDDIHSATIGMLGLVANYFDASSSIGHNSFAAAAEILTYSRLILMVGLADISYWQMLPDGLLRTLNAWLDAATTVSKAVIARSRNSLSIELLITLLLKDFTFSWVCDYADFVLLSPHIRERSETKIVHPGMSQSDVIELRCCALNYFQTLVRLVSTWMRAKNSNHKTVGRNVDLLSVGLDVATLVSRFNFLLEPDNGILYRMLSETQHGMKHHWRVHRSILSLMQEAVLISTSNPWGHSRVASSVVHTYFLSFLRLYNVKLKSSNDIPNGWTELITGYLTVLKVMISSKVPSGIFAVRSPRGFVDNPDRCDTFGHFVVHERESSTEVFHHTGVAENTAELHAVAVSFDRLRVSDFITREITLEFQATQRMKRDMSEINTPHMGARQVTEKNNDIDMLFPVPNTDVATSVNDVADSLAVGRGLFPSIPTLNLGKRKAVLDVSAETNFKESSHASNADESLDAIGFRHFTGDLMEDVVREEDLEECLESRRASQAVSEGITGGVDAQLYSIENVEDIRSFHSASNSWYRSREMVRTSFEREHQSSSSERKARQVPQKVKEHQPKIDVLDRDYITERSHRRLYLSDIVHASTVELLLALLVQLNVPTQECVEELSKFEDDDGYSISRKIQRHPTQLCLDKKRQNIPFILRTHLNRDENASIIPLLVLAAVNLGIHAERLLRLSCDALFRSERYDERTLVSRGAYAQVHRCVLSPELGTLTSVEVAVKLIDAPQYIHEPPNVNAVYSEIALFEAMEREPLVARLYDYGVRGDSFFVVMQHYPSSLKRWRSTQGPLEDEVTKNKMHIYFAIYAQCIDAIRTLEKYGVIHYDVKADNFLLEPIPGCSAEEFWNPKDSEPPFRAVVTDFGESRLFSPFETAGTLHNRGTAYVKAPEMLTLSNALKKDATDYNRQKQYKCGRSADIWALGCLLYEIIVGELLLYDADWICFFIRTVTPGNEILPLRSLATLDRLPSVKRFILWVLVRDPTRRPNLEDVKVEFDALRREVMRVSTPTNTNYVRYESKGLWENFSLRPTPLEFSWVTEPSTIDAVSLSVFFPFSTHYSVESIMKDDAYIDDTVKRWRLSHLKMAPAFTHASELDNIYFSDIFSLLDIGLIESNVTSTVICAREDKKAPSNIIDLITLFMRKAAAEGVATHFVSLPGVAAYGSDVNAAFSIEIDNASHFLRNMLASCEDHNASATVAVSGHRAQQRRVLIACLPHDPTVAFTVAAALYMCANEGGLRRAIISLSRAAIFESGLPTIHPTDAVRLSAWEAQSRVEAICKPGGEN